MSSCSVAVFDYLHVDVLITYCIFPSYNIADLKYLQSLNLQNCKYITDRGLVNLEHVRESLQVLDISGCPGITDRGLPHLYVLK